MMRLRAERLKRGLTYTALSYEVKIHPSVLGKIETRKMIPYKPHKQKLSKYFGVPATELFQEIGQDNSEEALKCQT